jgi:predicted nuclease of predicted toxin-antitoxin system
MRFVVDAQLPSVLAQLLADNGHDVIHVKQLPKAGDTPDAEIIALADAQSRCVVTKDSDFRHGHETNGHPRLLLHITIGNIKNRDLLTLVSAHLGTITNAFEQANFVELGRGTLTLHTPIEPTLE